MSFKEKIVSYLWLIRYHCFLTFSQMVIGFFLVEHRLDKNSTMLLIRYFLILGPLLYGGTYILNNILDYPLDKLSPAKQKRPLVSGKISLKTAWILFFCHISLAIIALIFSGSNLLSIFSLFFLLDNILYTVFAKNIPYIDLIFCSISHPARTGLGILMAGGKLLDFLPLLTINFFAVTNSNILKRIKEKDLDKESSRPVLKSYSRKTLIILTAVLTFFSLILLFFLNDIWQVLFASVLTLTMSVLLLTYLRASPNLKNLLLRIWR